MPLPVNNETPVIVSLEVGDQLYDVDGSELVKVSKAGDHLSPWSLDIGTVHHRLISIVTGGIKVAALWPSKGAQISDAPDRYDEGYAAAKDAAKTAVEGI